MLGVESSKKINLKNKTIMFKKKNRDDNGL